MTMPMTEQTRIAGPQVCPICNLAIKSGETHIHWIDCNVLNPPNTFRVTNIHSEGEWQMTTTPQPMTEQRAREILGEAIQPNGRLYNLSWYLDWSERTEPDKATLDGEFTADQLEAIAWWMRNQRRD
jgi:hypothetical protein